MPQIIPLWDVFNKDPFHPLYRNQVHHSNDASEKQSHFPC